MVAGPLTLTLSPAGRGDDGLGAGSSNEVNVSASRTCREMARVKRKMANIHRGEIAAEIGGEERVLCLTLGALAELEARLGAGDLVGLGERFAGGKVSARDLMAILGAGLRGGGNAITDDQLAQMSVEGGMRGAAEIAVRLLQATFGDGQ